MTFNTAVFDTHPGDRRQLERIFAKETDIRKHKGELVSCETFGSTQSMLVSPMKYDLFIVDATDKDDPESYTVNLEIAKEIIAFEVKDSTALDKYFDYVFTFRDHRFYTERKKE